MNSINKYCSFKPTLIQRIHERIRSKRYPEATPLHSIGFRPAVYPNDWKGGKV